MTGPVIHSVRLVPPNPVGGTRIRAQVDARAPGDIRPELEFRWHVRGRTLDAESPMIELPELRRGDQVAVSVVAIHGGERTAAMSASGRVENTRPRVRDVRLRRRTVGAGGEEWLAEAWGDDPDGDPVELSYTWLVNDKPSDQKGQSFPTDKLKRKDRLSVRVVANDGVEDSTPARSGQVTIENSAPDVASTPPPLDASGRYRYQIEAIDADGDRGLTYTLAEGPRGMKVDRSSGLVSWTPSSDQAGRHRVEVLIEDGKGGKTSHAFEIPIVAQYETLPASPR